MQDSEIVREMKNRYLAVAAQMDERSRRRWAATESQLFGWGGISAVSKATGISPNTIRKGVAELRAEPVDPSSDLSSRLRRPGAGRKPLTVTTPQILTALDHLICDSGPKGSSRFIKWTCKSPLELATELSKGGLSVSARTVSRILKSAGYQCPVITRSKAIIARTDWPQRFIEIDRHLGAAFNHQQPVMAISTRCRKRDFLSAEDVTQPPQPVEALISGDCVPPNHLNRNLSSSCGANPHRNRKTPQFKVTERVLKEIELAVNHAWDSIDEPTRTRKSELLILAEFFMSDSSLQTMEINLREQLKIQIRCLAMPPAIRKWNPLNQQIVFHMIECIDQESELLDAMTLQVIGC